MSLHNVIMIAYDAWIEGELVTPGWTEDLRFDIDAKVPAGASKDTLLLMLRQMLADRFGLRTHTEKKEVQGYKLVVAKNGPKLTDAAPQSSTERPPPQRDGVYRPSLAPNGFPELTPGAPGFMAVGNRARAQWYRITIAQLVKDLVTHSGTLIEDATGLKGIYDMSLYWVPNARPDAEPSGPDLSAALEEQLGLKLLRNKVAIEVVVVDELNKAPTPN
jgi:uncharacterized protein (TIGR03435 family)